MPATARIETTPATALDEQMREILQTQQQAFRKDMNPARELRLDRLARVERLLDADAEREFAARIAEDFGNRSPVETVLAESIFTRAAIKHARRHLKTWMKPRRVRTAMTYWPGHSRLQCQPLGVVGIISPWNYPLQLTLAPLVAAFAAGNRVMIKPSELTPRFSQALHDRLAAVFAQDEVVVINGNAEVGKAFASLPFDHLLFTGSTAVGRLVAQAAAKNLTPVTLELGGKSPAIIDASANLALAAERIAFGKLLNAGQTCIAPDYVLVPPALKDAFVAALRAAATRMYPAFPGNPDYTSIVSDRHYRRLCDLVADARARGAQILPLGAAAETPDPATRQLAPSVLLEVDDSMRVMQEEIFGPLLPVLSCDSTQAAIDYVNARDRPLALYWFGSDRVARERVLAQTISGGVTINDTLLHIAQEDLPFGGVGPSGQGHYHGEYGFRQMSKEKPVFLQSSLSGVRLLYPPYRPFTMKMLEILKRIS
ncbi:MAG: coniferyl aldehyde dehydrogenase [Dokdonella sp.]|uniref:coniferyl aldehyde dehydrogenase n=1 Tax=Dokdonella sp. TaxID=2291710 RepID=UPI0025B988E0|nr:coniferyl aldehyde dehydrogenase [Dokdonella sp.]MBZ0221788.1 coniferyl aldehyde dehydrogenase [Dokdonella sp.]MCC7255224.1 coniferyl aldehyde dehydrogenase [Dokdonella sp.]